MQQGCADAGLCYPPMDLVLPISVLAGATDAKAAVADQMYQPTPVTTASAEASNNAAKTKDSSSIESTGKAVACSDCALVFRVWNWFILHTVRVANGTDSLSLLWVKGGD